MINCACDIFIRFVYVCLYLHMYMGVFSYAARKFFATVHQVRM